ncbi:MAG: PAS domain-containing protein [Opitutaceae bacterium]|nr:PAS domain-containing protein [Opitutaceae bacterium]
MTNVSATPFEPPEHPAPLLDRTLVDAFLEHVPDIVFFKDSASRFIAVSRSKARRHDREPAELIGQSDADYFAPEHVQAARADEEKIMRTGKPILARLERTRFIDGREGWTEVSKLPLRDETGAIVGTFGLGTDVTETQTIKLELEQAHRELLNTSRLAGMAEVATGVLHNVGNVLTSVNVSANVLATGLQQSKAESLERVSALLQSHAGDLGAYLTTDPKGRRIPEFLISLGQHWLEERDRLQRELTSLQQSIDHIKEIVGMQQSYATTSGAVESLDPAALMEDALRMNTGALERHQVTCVRDFQPVPRMRAEKAKVLQILINLIRNAKYAAHEGRQAERTITLRIAPGPAGRVHLSVADNGIGIPARNMDRIFTHGFTTRPGGHGFGLHSSRTAARAMQGELTAQSPGPGQGATFTLDLPVA